MNESQENVEGYGYHSKYLFVLEVEPPCTLSITINQ